MKLHLPKMLLIAVMTACSYVQAAMTTPTQGTNKYTYVNDGWVKDANNTNASATPSRSNNKGAFMVISESFDAKSASYQDTSDGDGGVWVEDNVSVTNFNLGRWGGSVYVGAGATLSAFLDANTGSSSKSNGAADRAHIWVDGSFTLSNLKNFDSSGNDHYWHIGTNGKITLSGTTGIEKNNKAWHIEVVENNFRTATAEELAATLTNRSTTQTTHEFLEAGADLSSLINSVTIILGDGTEYTAASLSGTDGHHKATVNNAIKLTTLTWAGTADNDTWTNTGSNWVDSSGAATSFLNGDSVIFGAAAEGISSTVNVGSSVTVNNMAVNGSYTLNIVDSASLAVQGELNIAGALEVINNGTLTLNGEMTVNEGTTVSMTSSGSGITNIGGSITNNGTLKFISTNSNFIFATENGQITNTGTIDMSGLHKGNNNGDHDWNNTTKQFTSLINAISGGEVILTGAADAYSSLTLQLGGAGTADPATVTFAADYKAYGHLTLANYNEQTLWKVTGALTVYGESSSDNATRGLAITNLQKLLIVDGARVQTTGIRLGHFDASAGGGHLEMTGGELTTGNIIMRSNSAHSSISITGGSVEFTDATAVTWGQGSPTIAIGGTGEKSVTLKATQTNWTLGATNLATSIGNITIDAANTHSITLQHASFNGTITNNTANESLLILGEGAKVKAGESLTLNGYATFSHTITNEGSLTLNLGSSITLAGSQIISGGGTMHIMDGTTVIMGHSGTNGTAVVKGNTIHVHGGGFLKLGGNDLLGWGGGATGAIKLKGDSESKVATLQLGGRQTMKTDLIMEGNALVSSIGGTGDSYGGLNAYKQKGAVITVTGKNNIIDATLYCRDAFLIDVDNDGDELEVKGNVVIHANGDNNGGYDVLEYDAGSVVKKGDGKLTFSGSNNTFNKKYLHEAGTTVMSGAATFSSAVLIKADTFETSGITTISGAITNNGTFAVSGGIATISGAITNNGTFAVSGGIATISGASGAVTNNGAITVSGGSADFANTLDMAQGSSLSVSGGTATIGGAVTNNGAITVSGGTADFTNTNTLNMGAGSSLRVSGGAASVSGALNVTGENVSLSQSDTGVLNLNGAVTISENAELTLNGTVGLAGTILNNGTLGINGTIELLRDFSSYTAEDEVEILGYTHDDTPGDNNGFQLVSGAKYYLTTGGALANENTDTITVKRGEEKFTVGIDDADQLYFTTSAGSMGSTFYVSSGEVTVETSDAAQAQAYVLSAATTMELSAGAATKAGVTINAAGNSTINLAAGSTLNAFTKEGSGTITLTGSGTYVAGKSSAVNVSTTSLQDSTKWTGTVLFTGNVSESKGFDNSFGNVNSTIEMKGAHGWLSNGLNMHSILKLTREGEGVNDPNGFTVTAASNWQHTFSNKVWGNGDFTVANTGDGNPDYFFTGDLSEWSGAFKVSNPKNTEIIVKMTGGGNLFAENAGGIVVTEDAAGTVSATLGSTDSAVKTTMRGSVINNSESAALNLTVQGNTDFQKDVTVTSMTVNSGMTATMNATLKADTVNLADQATISGGTMSNVQMSKTGVSAASTANGAKGSITDADVEIAQLAQDASFTIQDMTLTNTTITAATVDTKVNLSNVSTTGVQLAKGNFVVTNQAATTYVGTGGSDMSFATNSYSGITLANTEDGAGSSIVLNLGDLSTLTPMGPAVYDSITISLDGFTMSNYNSTGILFAGDSWLGELLTAQGATQYVASGDVAASANVGGGAGGSTVGVSFQSNGSVGTIITITGLNVPEPTTATLSLLALAALAARRRRK